VHSVQRSRIIDAQQDLRRNPQIIERQAKTIAQHARQETVSGIALGTGQRHMTQKGHATAADAADNVNILHQRDLRVAANLVIKPLRHQQTLIAIGQRKDQAAHRNRSFDPACLQAVCVELEAEAGGTLDIAFGHCGVDEFTYLVFPAGFKFGVGMKEQQPVAACSTGSFRQLDTPALAAMDHRTAGIFGNLHGLVAGTAIDHHHIFHKPRNRAGHDSAQGPRQGAAGIEGWDHHTYHDARTLLILPSYTSAGLSLFVLVMFLVVAYLSVMAQNGQMAHQYPGARVDFSSEESGVPQARRRGRGALSNGSGRFETYSKSLFDDGWRSLEDLPAFKTTVTDEKAKKIITRNQSPDISFDRSINPYRGCEHGCSYCFARPTHAYMGLSPGIDFESKLFAKSNAAELLEQELANPKYIPQTIAIGTNTDPYQPIERRFRIMRAVLEVLARFNHPVGIVTKSALVVRDLDILAPMAEKGLVKVALSVTTLDAKLSRAMEPRASTPEKRLSALHMLSAAGVPTAVMFSPIIPALNDAELESVLKAAAQAGVKEAGYILLRLPLEVRDLFREWLMAEQPDRAAHVLSLLRSMRDGKDYDATWGRRMRGTGPYAWSIGRRFEIAAKRLGLNEEKTKLTSQAFTRAHITGTQLDLF